MSFAAAPAIVATGSVINFNAASANVAIPNNSSGQPPNYIRLIATAACYVKLGTTNGVVATAGDLMIQPADALIVRSIGLSYVAAIQQSAGGVLQISPLENV